ncbi:MAG: [Fe-Fe] hydrogenase large subunit C-terminal domain-containing protein [Bacillota bacterium]
MREKFNSFTEKRAEIFRQLIKKAWFEELNTNDLEEILRSMQEKYGYSEREITFLRDHMRLLIGLNPRGEEKFTNEIESLKNFGHIQGPVVSKISGFCAHCHGEGENVPCQDSCKYEAHMYRRQEGPQIIDNQCLSCGQCIAVCSFGAIAEKVEFIPLIHLLKDNSTPVFAAVAPSIAGQFGEKISLGQLRTAFRMMGFQDMVEVALFADILTIREAYEFDSLVKTQGDFFLTSCCCPVWINFTEKQYPALFAHMSPSVSPMIASGRVLKALYPNAKVVFISPCLAKKAEAKDLRLEGAIDFVVTFKELEEIFKAIDINLGELPGDEKDQASFAGRVYARTGGVSFSVKTVVNRIAPKRLIKFKSKRVDGVKECKAILEDLAKGIKIEENFIEGMGCPGGCVGGPRTLIDVNKATKLANEFGEDSLIMTPFDNMNVIKTLKELGFKEIGEIVDSQRARELFLRKNNSHQTVSRH